MSKILVVDDESDICAIIKYNLEKEGFEVDTADSAETCLNMDLSSYSLFLLDIMMGEISGLSLAKQIKASKLRLDPAIIFITAKDSEEDVLKGFDIGADDYISKPFSTKELVSRVKAVLRRCGKLEEIITYQGLILDKQSKKLFVDGKEVVSTKTEFGILSLLLENPSKVFSRENILSIVWDDQANVLGRTVDVNITRLRHKIGKYGQYIITRHGYGYSFEMKDEDL